MPARRTTAEHLLLKGRTYYYRQAVPIRLRHLLGMSELRHSLRTGYLGTARLKAKRLRLAVGDLFRAIEDGRITPMDRQQLRAYIEDIFRKLLEENEIASSMGLGVEDYHECFRHDPEAYDARLLGYKRLLLPQCASLRHAIAAHFLIDSGTALPDDPADFNLAANDIVKHFINYYEIIRRRSEGDYAYERTIYPPIPPRSATPAEGPGKEVPAGPNLRQTMEDYRADRVKDDWDDSVAYDIMSTLEWLPRILGDVPVRSLDKTTMADFKSVLQKMPPNITKMKAYHGKTVEEILAMEPKKTISPVTVKNVLTNISTFFNWCCARDYLPENTVHGLRAKAKKKRKDAARRTYAPEELRTIFSCAEYRADGFESPYMFWLPLLGLFTGMRLEEICQLRLTDVREEDGIPYLRVKESYDEKGNRVTRTKTESSDRNVPLHPVLLVTGFRDYVARTRAAGHERVFPELTPDKRKGKYGSRPSKWFGRFRKRLGITDERLDFHAFRKHFIDHCGRRRLPKDARTQVVGHEPGDIHDGVYRENLPVRTLYEEVVSKVDYELDLSHLKSSKYGKGAVPKAPKSKKSRLA